MTHSFDLFCRTLLNSKEYLYSSDLFLLDVGISNIKFIHSQDDESLSSDDESLSSDDDSPLNEPIELD